MNVCIKVIPHNQQRYPTVGDWWFEGKNLYIRVSAMGNWRYEMCVAAHELVEVLLCKHEKISQRSVDEFDIAFEQARKDGNTDEPGDDSRAPYRVQHGIATGVERILAALLGIDWNKYDAKINSL
jgi:hypothetical protein